jgi:uncharacterized SAM-dependent methyltransferase
MMGTDLVKSSTQLLAAYDDAAGITAAFNLNLLARINRELNGNFELRRFRHEARWVADQSRIEMHLVSKASQSVTIAGAKCEAFFEDGESIWTESSRKFLPSFLQSAATHAGFAVSGQWVDQEWPFAENLWIAD